jgi:hypothetical protein
LPKEFIEEIWEQVETEQVDLAVRKKKKKKKKSRFFSLFLL